MNEMSTHNVYRLVFTTEASQDKAKQLARKVIENKLAACVNLIDGVQSIYEWQGQVVEDTECKLVIKTKLEKIEALKQLIVAHHSYDVPEIQVIAVVDGHAAYFNWMDEVLG
jgi:periplasmic divalent cation tolerance protein